MINVLCLTWLLLSGPPPWDYATHFQQVTTDDGLSQSTIWQVIQDPTGFLWIGTTSGLNRYDGYRFIVYKSDPSDPNTLSDNQVRALARGGDGAIWVGTGFGLNRLDPETHRITRYFHEPDNPNSLSFNYITALVADADRGLWVGTRDGINYLDFKTNHFTRYQTGDDHAKGLLNDTIRSLAWDKSDRLWIGTNAGLFYFVDGAFYGIPVGEDGLSHRQVRALAVSKEAVWAGTTHGLNRINLESGRVTHFFKGDAKNQLKDDWINALTFDQMGHLWLGLRNGGLAHMNVESGACRHFLRDPLRNTTINANDIISVFIDQTNLLWAGSFTHGLSKLNLNQRRFNSYDTRLETNDRLREVQAIHEDHQGILWVGMQNGLARIQDPEQPAKMYTADGQPGSLSESQIHCIKEGPDQSLWVGTYAGGLNRYLPKQDAFKVYSDNQEGGVSHRSVFDLALDDRQRLWVATRKGLDLYHVETDLFVHIPYPDEETLRQRETGIYDLLTDKEGLIWLGTDGGGLCRFDPETGDFKRFRYLSGTTKTLAHDSVYSMLRIEDTLWIGTISGLRKMDIQNQTLTKEELMDGLNHSSVYSLVQDDDGRLWMSTTKGVIRYNPANPDEELLVFTISDGLASTDYFKNAGIKRGDGEILFGGIHGLNGFFSRTDGAKGTPPRVVLTSFKIMGREAELDRQISYTRALTLTHKQNMFSFEFAALDFRTPAKNRYVYQLEGFDQTWRSAGTRSFAEYSNLPGGSYTFKVKASGETGEQAQGVSIPLYISPPFWKTLPFQALIVVLLIFLVLGTHYYRAWKIKRSNEELEELVNIRSRELEEAKQELLDMAHRTGIFEIADGVLRQIIQQIRDVEESIKGIHDLARNSVVPGFVESNHFLKQHLSTEAVPGEQIFEFTHRYAEFIDQFEVERQNIHHKTLKLVQKADTMKDTISVQHAYATTPLYTQEIYIREMINDALKLESVDLASQGVKIRKHFRADPQYKTAKVKLMQVLTQVLQNSIEALKAHNPSEKIITIEVTKDDDDTIRIRIEDNGCGMSNEELEKAFTAGYSQWDGHSGLGLHEAVNAMRETGNDLMIESTGRGEGAAVTLLLR